VHAVHAILRARLAHASQQRDSHEKAQEAYPD
jgi:hypothetical protein